MSRKELSMMVVELMRLRKEDEAALAERQAELEASRASEAKMRGVLDELVAQNAELLKASAHSNRQIALLTDKIAALTEQLQLERKNRYGSKSQKKRKKADDSDNITDHQEQKDKFDGSGESIGNQSKAPKNSANDTSSETEPSAPSDEDVEHAKEILRDYRKGLKYKTMKADKVTIHKSDITRLPEGAEFMAFDEVKSYEQITQIVEHRYQIIKYKLNGKVIRAYLPKEGEPEIIDRVPGTHASSKMMAYLAYNKYVLDTPVYREIGRLFDENMRTCRSTVSNWLRKGSHFVKELVEILKSRCIVKNGIVNCDETWCRVKVKGKYLKRYIWCLVNKKERIVIYCYEDGSRGRDVLKHIIGNAELKALQSDGYNVYMYLDDKLIDIEHLCCMAHARAKFQYAWEIAGDENALYFLECIAELYQLEDEYKAGLLTQEQIKHCRNNFKTNEIIIRLRSKLDQMLADGHPMYGELMEKALRYLDTFWTQLFAYRNDGEYTIDNTLAERFIRPLAGERKNSLFFGSNVMAEVSAAYHTIISTCKMQGVSALRFLQDFFQAVVKGRRDYTNLLPEAIKVNANNF